MQHNNIFRKGIAMLVVCVSSYVPLRSAVAEGDKTNDPRWEYAYGANRVTRTVAGFDVVNGDFTVPIIFIPAINTREAKPTFYLGSGHDVSNTEVDAGLQYEYHILRGNPRGWALFISRNGGFHNPSVVRRNGTRGAYRAGPGTENPGVTKYGLAHFISLDGSVRLNMSSESGSVLENKYVTFTWRQRTVVYQPAHLDEINVKRTIGMTQNDESGDWGLDGSFMHGCIYSNGRIHRVADSLGDFENWSANRTNQDRTGFKPGGNDQGNPPAPIVQFPNPAQYPNRYHSEAVNINLRRATRVAGALVTPTRRTVRR